MSADGSIKPSAFDAALERMYRRQGVDTLATHLEATYGIGVTKLTRLDVVSQEADSPTA